MLKTMLVLKNKNKKSEMGKEEKELVLNSLSKKKNQRKWGVGVESWSCFFLLWLGGDW
jgi:hypothetical protein